MTIPRFNESEFAQQVADRYQTDHRLEVVSSDDFDLIDTLARLYDEPYADSSAIPTYRVCQMARKHVTVALSGDGGDESLGGYRRYRMHLGEERVRSRLPLGLRRPLFGALGSVYPKADWAPRVLRAKTTFQAMAMDAVQAYHHSMSHLRAAERRALVFARVPARARAATGRSKCFATTRSRGDRRPARPDSVPGLQDLAGGRHQHQGRPRQHGALARSARTADGPRAGRSGWPPCPATSRSAAAKANTCSRRPLSRCCRTTCCTGPRWGSLCPWRAGCAGPLQSRMREAVLGASAARSGFFNAETLGTVGEANI